MTTEYEKLYRRLLRRETHDSRTTPAVFVATVAAVLAAGTITITVIALAAPGTGETIGNSVMDALGNRLVLTVAATLLLVLGAVAMSLALSPGRRTRHALITNRAGVVVESAGLAESIASTVARNCGLQRRQVRASVHRRRLVTVTVRPISGVPVDADAITEAARSTTSALGLRLRPRVYVSDEGFVA